MRTLRVIGVLSLDGVVQAPGDPREDREEIQPFMGRERS